jgi:GNAT superfamily N-acetyltransferase
VNPDHVLTQTVPTSEEREFLEDRLYEHNRDRTGSDDGELFSFFIRDANDQILGGLTGWTWARACEIETLWVHPEWRGRGYATRLLASAEKLARERGCEVIALDSYSFQAPGFYQKHGFELFAELAGFPPGHSRSYLVKRLAPADTDQ